MRNDQLSLAREDGTARADDGPTVAVVAYTTALERTMIEEWLRSDEVPAEYRTPTRPESLDLDSRVLAEELVTRTDDPLILPVRVVWLPAERDGARRVRFSDVLALTNPRNPNLLLQKWLVRRGADRHRIVVAQPARLSELREALSMEGGDGDDAALARYVTRRAVVALERAERAVIGDRYKVPRLVAAQIMDSPIFRRRLDEIAAEHGLSRAEVEARARSSLDELVAVQSRLVTDLFSQAMRPLHAAAWTVHADESGLRALRESNRRYSLVFLPSHRSYADAFVLGDILAANDFPGNHIMGGANLTFWPIGPVARRTGTVFIRRSFADDDVYKAALEEYFAFLLSKRFNLEWYFEGGRTRTGKLRPPRYGLLSYVANAIRGGRVEDAMLVPVSITYEGLAEVAAVAAEQTGATKKPEGLGWLVRYARNQRKRAGNVYVRFGDPVSMRELLVAGGDPDLAAPALAADPSAAPTDPEEIRALRRKALQKVAFEVAVGINCNTPVTVNCLVTLALLGVRDRSLTLEEVRAVIAPVRRYLDRRGVPQGGLPILDVEGGLEDVLSSLTHAGVVTTYAGGEEPVYSIQPGQHLVAAFYRNSGVHWFVNRSIMELAILYAHANPGDDPARVAWDEAKNLRDLLKFEFFFPDRDTFEAQMRDELAWLVPSWGDTLPTKDEALTGLVETGFFMSHRTLRSFFDAQLVVAERLAVRDPELEVDRAAFLSECVAVGRQMLLQRRLYGPESVSSELFASALDLARNRGLLDRDEDPEIVRERRKAFATELSELAQRVALAESLDVSNRKVER
ncbi:glycerol-3-phosphate acyltransferase [Rhodococcus rhodochrous J3]|uniref:Glycerol-3-phosphate acyltransferase n=1 Tax=Rhodococcus rhodochrous J3 TaxID=903528 RepID=A0ABY1MB21_RHORH|nr:glycerol-3-phosphate 1-O-acyltransferase [Rhodococcus rhodochrous]AYA25199.1 glycerol-3-phosphate 1-O-acyltransferase [Rhodococcus rhodochrous]MBF4478759.1 glycerol-3-phosphate 1-O-acyltransferase [Rhodococcus rhodochrous]MCB8909538.1 glycerol-3-phosphate 1-O-acyltransferase [Rhodococcus rhodochrous]TWH61504.1 glycerol-3-phosphate acyltransferase [Rhodococcus rhodochrous J38]SMG38931.1 glycerol-3-phosphate acyltransferase [Rhodococcus rhodochrous J3]